MTRRHITFECGEEKLVGTLDGTDGPVGLLIVSGGNEVRSGAFASQAKLAAQIATAGYPVLRFDRRGAGDSSGENLGFRNEAADIAAAIGEFRQICSSLERIIGFGNCDAASALMIEGGPDCDALVLANPWTFGGIEPDEMPAAVVRARYAAKLTNPREWHRLLKGDASLRKLASGLKRAFGSSAAQSSLASEMRQGLEPFKGDVRFLISGRDRTGRTFCSAWGADDRITVREGADHAFSALEDREWLTAQLLSALDEQTRQLDMG